MAVYDCFTFFNEIDQLKVRLHVLSPYVDKFVIVELNKTFRGADKNYVFKEHKNEFKEYLNKIIYITLDDIPQCNGPEDFSIEIFQRNGILNGLEGCNPDDIIMISDVDEIPNPRIFSDKFKLSIARKSEGRAGILRAMSYLIFAGGKKCLLNVLFGKAMTLAEWTETVSLSCNQQLYYYYMNCRAKTDWCGTVILKYKNIQIPQWVRMNRWVFPYINSGGWHYSYLGGVTKIKEKLKSIIDLNHELTTKMQEYSSDDKYIEQCLNQGLDIYGRKGKQFEYKFINIESTDYPDAKYIQENFKEFIRDNSNELKS